MLSSLQREKHHESIVLPVHFTWTESFRRSRGGDPLIHHGRHFGRTVRAMCNMQALVVDGILCMGEDGEIAEETLTFQFVPILSHLSLADVSLSNAGPGRSIEHFKNFCGWYPI